MEVKQLDDKGVHQKIVAGSGAESRRSPVRLQNNPQFKGGDRRVVNAPAAKYRKVANEEHREWYH